MKLFLERLEDRLAPAAIVRFDPAVVTNYAAFGTPLRSVPGLVIVDGAVSDYTCQEGVLYAEADGEVTLDQIPNDPLYPQLYGMTKISAPAAWDVTTGSGNFLIAVIDTGADFTHPDLAPRLWRNPGEIPGNGIDDDGNGFRDDDRGWDFYYGNNTPDDDHGHGTHVSGTIGAIGNNSLGVTGLNWDIEIMALKILGPHGGGTWAAAIQAIDYAVSNGARLSSNSWGGQDFSQGLYDTLQAAGERGHLAVFAAGNRATNLDDVPHWPASFDLPNIVSVAATDSGDNLATFSNYSATQVDLGAPGVGILSTVPMGTCALCNSTGYRTASGTSMATPHVAGAAALLWDLHPELTWQEVKAKLLDTGDPLSSLTGKTVSGKRLNAGRLLGELPPPPPPPPPPPTNNPPVAVDDMFADDGKGWLLLNVLANDSDPDGDVLRVQSYDAFVDGGRLRTNDAGQIFFKADRSFTGRTSFEYTISDSHGGTDVGTVFIDVVRVRGANSHGDAAFLYTWEIQP